VDKTQLIAKKILFSGLMVEANGAQEAENEMSGQTSQLEKEMYEYCPLISFFVSSV
jgi:hypothetical protein